MPHSLRQILHSSRNKLQCFELKDFPRLKRRGFMLDVSRCKVPTMKSLFELIDLLSILRFNEIQLYIEHTLHFATTEPYGKIRRHSLELKFKKLTIIVKIDSLNLFQTSTLSVTLKDGCGMNPTKFAECPDGFRR